MNALLTDVTETSRNCGSIVIGEDLGTVPPRFRDTLRETAILGYRVLFFERRKAGFLPPERYDAEALACISTHDLPPLRGWWQGQDLVERECLGLISGGDARRAWTSRRSDKRALIAALAQAGVLPKELGPLNDFDAMLPDALPDELNVAIHKFVARTPCRLVAVQLEDLLGSLESVNIPGTTDEHPNWRRKSAVDVEDIDGMALLGAICNALTEERPRKP
jgi:4-alpha-glucanotransferase